MAVNPALTVAVPAPESQGVVIGSRAATMFLWFIASDVAVAQFLAVRVGPGREFRAVASDVEVIQANQLQANGTGDEAREKGVSL
jgi:hypothetical protein